MLRVLLVSGNAAFASVLDERFEVDHATSFWDAERASSASYDAIVVEDALVLDRLRRGGIEAPALLLTSTANVTDACASLPADEAASGTALARAIVALIERHRLQRELDAARDQVTQLRKLRHDLATPLGVALAMTHVVLRDAVLANEDREALEDVERALGNATRIIKGQDSAAPAAAEQLNGAAADDAMLERGIVLIADDDAAIRRSVCATLASERYSVLQAADGEEAWRLIREHRPAVAILDWQMPVYSGLELSGVIKGDPLVQGMTVIMLTGRAAQEDREAGARARADVYLTKPFSPAELLEAVQRALGIT
jgi:CheY-like chemotaxis protein